MVKRLDPEDESSPREPVAATWALILAGFGLLFGALAIYSHLDHPRDPTFWFSIKGGIAEILLAWVAYAVTGIGLFLAALSVRRLETPPWPLIGLTTTLCLAAILVVLRLTLRVGL